MTALFAATTIKGDVSVCDAPPRTEGMIWITSGTFRMGSDKHYPEEAPAHRVTVICQRFSLRQKRQAMLLEFRNGGHVT